ncbi:hypothetical protein FOMA001_g19226 [Fusarium oxysporum f. sp. matthiolae]|nr:hypothetical protein FOMA001_g19226 [Fusarium oxysporum f. sp. matthiolae]
MASKSCPLKFSAMPMESARLLEPILQPCTASGPVSADRAETPARSEYMPCPDANKEASAEARQHRGSAEPAALGRPPPSSPIRIVPQLPTIIDSPALTSPSIATEAPRAKEVSIVRDPLTQLPLRYDSPEAIYSRYVAARSVWYAAQPRGSIKTNQEYRKAKGLPQRYDKRSYEWCLDFKQMSKRCVTQTGSREWTKEEMMAYLDWCSAEDKRVEAQVAREMGDNPLATKRRGMKDIWKSAEKDSREQQALHSVRDKTERCIIVKM